MHNEPKMWKFRPNLHSNWLTLVQSNLDLDITDLVFFGPRIPFCSADSLWGGVTHTFGQVSKHVGDSCGTDRALGGGLESHASTLNHQQ